MKGEAMMREEVEEEAEGEEGVGTRGVVVV